MMTDWSYFSFALSSCSLMAGSSRSASTMSRTHRGSSSSSSTSSRVKSTGDSRDKKSTKSSFRKLVHVKIIWSQEGEENSKGTMVYWGVPNRGDDRLWHRNTNCGVVGCGVCSYVHVWLYNGDTAGRISFLQSIWDGSIALLPLNCMRLVFIWKHTRDMDIFIQCDIRKFLLLREKCT